MLAHWLPVSTASLESSPQRLLVDDGFGSTAGLHISELDLAFLHASLAKRSARFHCLDNVTLPTALAQCGYDARLQLDMV